MLIVSHECADGKNFYLKDIDKKLTQKTNT